MRVLGVSSPIYAHTVNARPFLRGLAESGAEVHHATASPWASETVPGTILWDTGPVPGFTPAPGRVREVAQRYAWLLDDAACRFERVLEIVDLVRPDVVLTDSLGHVAALAAERRGLPWVSFGDGPLHFPDRHTPPFGAGLPYRTPQPWVWRNTVVRTATRRVVVREAQRRYDRLRERRGLPARSTPVLEAALSPYLHLHAGVPELEYPRAHLPAQVHFVGALRPAPRGDEPLPPWWEEVVTASGPGPVVVTQGTLRSDVDELLRPALTVLREQGRRGVLLVGAGAPESLGGPGVVGRGPDGGARHAVEPFVPYADLLPHASAFVTNGGWTGVLLALAHGVPVVQVGRTEEKADIGRRVAWAGAGIHLPRADHGPLARAVARATEDPALHDTARRVAVSLAVRDPGRDGARLVRELLTG